MRLNRMQKILNRMHMHEEGPQQMNPLLVLNKGIFVQKYSKGKEAISCQINVDVLGCNPHLLSPIITTFTLHIFH